MNRMIGFLASKCTGLTPSSTPPCGGAFGRAVADATAEAIVDDMMNVWGREAEPRIGMFSAKSQHSASAQDARRLDDPAICLEVEHMQGAGASKGSGEGGYGPCDRL
jgi:hypothetical protein